MCTQNRELLRELSAEQALQHRARLAVSAARRTTSLASSACCSVSLTWSAVTILLLLLLSGLLSGLLCSGGEVTECKQMQCKATTEQQLQNPGTECQTKKTISIL